MESVCRICLASGTHVRAGAFAPDESESETESPSLARRVYECTRVRIRTADGFPTGLCRGCREDLDVAHDFLLRSRQSDRALRDGSYERRVVKVECDVKVEPDSDEIKLEEEEEDAPKTEEEEPPAEEERANRAPPLLCEYKCETCASLLPTKAALKQHYERAHGVRRRTVGKSRVFTCTECPYSTAYRQTIVYHMRVHTGERPYACDACDSRFAQPGALKTHRKTHSDEMHYTCAECGKQFKYRDTYENHRAVHADAARFACDVCQKRLKSKDTLAAHMNRHRNIKNFACDKCGALFVTRVELHNHAKKHSPERWYACDLCAYRSYQKKGLKRHLERHAGVKRFKCGECDAACHTNGELVAHSRRHTREKNYACPVCDAHFAHGSSVNKHALKIHGVKYSRGALVDRRTVKPTC